MWRHDTRNLDNCLVARAWSVFSNDDGRLVRSEEAFVIHELSEESLSMLMIARRIKKIAEAQ